MSKQEPWESQHETRTTFRLETWVDWTTEICPRKPPLFKEKGLWKCKFQVT